MVESGSVYLYVALLFGATGSTGSLGFSTAALTAAATSAVAPQPAGFTFGGSQMAAFGSSTLGTQPQTTSTQTTVALPGFSLPTTATAGTGQPGGFQFGGMQSSSAPVPTLGTGSLTTTSTPGFTFGTLPSTGTGLTGLLGTGAQTGTTSLFGGVKPGLLCNVCNVMCNLFVPNIICCC